MLLLARPAGSLSAIFTERLPASEPLSSLHQLVRRSGDMLLSAVVKTMSCDILSLTGQCTCSNTHCNRDALIISLQMHHTVRKESCICHLRSCGAVIRLLEVCFSHDGSNNAAVPAMASVVHAYEV